MNNKLCVEINGKDEFNEYDSDSSTSTYSSNNSYLDDVKPIKIIAKNTNKLQSKVVIGKGLCCNIVALPHFGSKNNKSRRPYRVLLDSGSDGDILFVRRNTPDCVPTKRRISPQKWRTSCGTFKTDKVGKDLEFSFPEYSESRLITISPDIMELPESAQPPAYDLILGVQTKEQ